LEKPKNAQKSPYCDDLRSRIAYEITLCSGIRSFSGRFLLATMGALSVAMLSTKAHAAESYWNGTIDSWNNPSNWSTPSVPGSGDVANVNAGEARITSSSPIVNQLNVGRTPGTNGTVTVDGPGATLSTNPTNASGHMWIGREGMGNLNVTNGGQTVAGGEIVIGRQTGGVGTVTVDGPGSLLESKTILSVGYESGGVGVLEVTGGGRAASTGTGSNHGVFIGNRADSNGKSSGKVTVTGSGSSLQSASILMVGNGGVGTLTVDDYGMVTAVGNFAVGNIFNAIAGTGTLELKGGGQASTTSGWISIGNNTGSIGNATVTGTNSLLQSGAGLYVADLGTGTLEVSNGGKATAATFLRVGSGTTGVGTLKVGPDGEVTSAGATTIGRLAGSKGDVTVTGPNAFLKSGAVLAVGDSGTGTLAISGGGVVDSYGLTAVSMDNGIRIGNGPNSSGLVTVDGQNSQLLSKNHLWVGFQGQGELRLTDQAKALIDREIVIGRQTGGVGTVTVDGAGSLLESKTIFSVGLQDGGNGSLHISNGGKASSTGTAANHGVFIGNQLGSTGEITVDGGTSLLESKSNLHIGHTGAGTLNLINAGNATATGDINIGYNGTGDGAVSIGTGSTLHSDKNIYVGGSSVGVGGKGLLSGTGTVVANGGTGTITVLGPILGSGGVISPGDTPGSIGTLTIDGNVVFKTGGAIDLDIGSSNTQSDLLKVNGTVEFEQNSKINVTGYTPGNANPFTSPTDQVTVITSSGGVTTNYDSLVTIAGQASTDFLTASAALDSTGNNVVIQTGLSWYSTDEARKAEGNFTIGSAGSFTLGAELTDTTYNRAAGWNGDSLTKKGDGTLNLTVANTFSGAATIEEGTLIASHQDALQNAKVDVWSGSTFQTTSTSSSTVGSLTSTGGTIELGGNLHSKGDINLTNTDYDVAIIYNGTPSTDKLITSGGNITISGGTLNVNDAAVDTTLLAVGSPQSFHMMQAAGTLSGQFGNMVWQRNSLFNLTQDNPDGQNLYVNLAYANTTPFSPYAGKREHNMGEVSDVLNWATLNDPTFVQPLAGMSNAQIRNWIDQARGSEIVADALTLALWKPWQPAYSRLELRRANVSSPSDAGLSSRAGETGTTRSWINLVGGKTDVSSDGNARSYDIERRGVVLGVDHAINENAFLGVQFAYLDHQLDASWGNRINSQDFSVGLYASISPLELLRADAYLGYGWQDYDYRRTDMMGRHRARYDGNALHASIQVSTPINMRPGFTFGPVVGLDYQRATMEPFTEKGISGNQRIDRANHDILTGRIGLAAQAQMYKVRWNARLDYGHYLNGKNRPEITSSFLDSPGSPEMNLYGINTGRDYVEAGVGFEIFLDPKEKVSFFGDYNYQHASRERAHSGRLGLSIKW